MDPATILSVIATSAKLAKSSWDPGEALYAFTKDAIVLDREPKMNASLWQLVLSFFSETTLEPKPCLI